MSEDEDILGNDLGEVSACECGGVNFTIGAVTLHLQPDEVEGFIALVGMIPKLARPEPNSDMH